MNSFIIIYTGVLAIGLMLWVGGLIAGKRRSNKHGEMRSAGAVR